MISVCTARYKNGNPCTNEAKIKIDDCIPNGAGEYCHQHYKQVTGALLKEGVPWENIRKHASDRCHHLCCVAFARAGSRYCSKECEAFDHRYITMQQDDFNKYRAIKMRQLRG